VAEDKGQGNNNGGGDVEAGRGEAMKRMKNITKKDRTFLGLSRDYNVYKPLKLR
jgi:hypothetical protein